MRTYVLSATQAAFSAATHNAHEKVFHSVNLFDDCRINNIIEYDYLRCIMYSYRLIFVTSEEVARTT